MSYGWLPALNKMNRDNRKLLIAELERLGCADAFVISDSYVNLTIDYKGDERILIPYEKYPHRRLEALPESTNPSEVWTALSAPPPPLFPGGFKLRHAFGAGVSALIALILLFAWWSNL